MSDQYRPVLEHFGIQNTVATGGDGVLDAEVPRGKTHNKPVAMVGAGRLAAAVWATSESQGTRRHTFNVFRIESETGRVTQCFSAADVPDLVRLAEALTLAMAE